MREKQTNYFGEDQLFLVVRPDTDLFHRTQKVLIKRDTIYEVMANDLSGILVQTR